MPYEYHVAKNGSDLGKGTKEDPFLTINRAASLAQPGDTVIVHEGVYREWVKPQNSGLSNTRRITYLAAEGEKVIIKGSEQIRGWEQFEGSIWRVVLPNGFFGDFNPYREEIFGDWFATTNTGRPKHLGDVYLNGISFYEAGSLEELHKPKIREKVRDDWTGKVVPVHHPEQTKYLWYAEVDAETTTIYANFHAYNPNTELVEINVRKCCFYPDRIGINYITVKGFELAQAATPWTPPTADQPGLLGPNWSKGWIIEDNVIHDAKCSAISLGKEIHTGHNFATTRRDKPGYQYQLESVFTARHLGWSKERIGSHIVRRNTIYDCGQNGIVGHLGCAFSVIEDNHIHDIALIRQFYGHEIAGIKLHAAIDVKIEANHIHDCSLGLWLDWETQGTRVTRNVLHSNSRDVFIEVSHGPYVVDHNVFASPVSLENFSQGGAYVGNLFLGSIRQEPVIDRATPYHAPHSTEVTGYAIIVGGDDRFIGNIFGDGQGRDAYDVELPDFATVGYGTAVHDHCPASPDEYFDLTESRSGDHRRFATYPQAVNIRDNAYLGNAKAFRAEERANAFPDGSITLEVEADGSVTLSAQLSEVPQLTQSVTTADLGHVRFVDADFEEPDGSELILNKDLLGEEHAPEGAKAVGPIASLSDGWSGVVWRPTGVDRV